MVSWIPEMADIGQKLCREGHRRAVVAVRQAETKKAERGRPAFRFSCLFNVFSRKRERMG